MPSPAFLCSLSPRMVLGGWPLEQFEEKQPLPKQGDLDSLVWGRMGKTLDVGLCLWGGWTGIHFSLKVATKFRGERARFRLEILVQPLPSLAVLLSGSSVSATRKHLPHTSAAGLAFLAQWWPTRHPLTSVGIHDRQLALWQPTGTSSIPVPPGGRRKGTGRQGRQFLGCSNIIQSLSCNGHLTGKQSNQSQGCKQLLVAQGSAASLKTLAPAGWKWSVLCIPVVPPDSHSSLIGTAIFTRPSAKIALYLKRCVGQIGCHD